MLAPFGNPIQLSPPQEAGLNRNLILHPQNDFAELFARFQPLLRSGGVPERIDFVEHRFGARYCHELQHLVKFPP